MNYDVKQFLVNLVDFIQQKEIVQVLYDLLDKNMVDFDVSLVGMDKVEIVDLKEVFDMWEIYDFI